MPTRTREHELETLSQLAFAGLMPVSWVVRSADSDYGIDREVELFESGTATGAMFKVQLKGTDSLKATRQIPLEKLAYWCSLDMPVLVVLHLAETGATYAKWAHAIDPYPLRTPDQKEKTVHFEDGLVLTKDSWAQLESELSQYRSLRSALTRRPTLVWLEPHFPKPADSQLMKRLLRDAVHASGGALKLCQPGTPYGFLLKASVTELHARLPTNRGSVTLHLKGDTSTSGRNLGNNVEELLLLVATLLARAGASSRAVEVMASVATRAGLPNMVAFAPYLIAAHETEGAAGEALKAYVVLSEAAPLNSVVDVWLMPITGNLPRLSEPDFNRLVTQIERIATVREKLGLSQPASTLFYTLSHIKNARGDTAEALRLLRRAILADSAYGGRGYYWRERGGLEFVEGEYAASSRSYGQALRLMPERHDIRVLRCDALLRAADVPAAVELAESFTDLPDHIKPLAKLLSTVIPHVQEAYGELGAPETTIGCIAGKPANEWMKRVQSHMGSEARQLVGKPDGAGAEYGPLLTYDPPGSVDEHSDDRAIFLDALTATLAAQHAPHWWALTTEMAFSAEGHSDLTDAILRAGITHCADTYASTYREMFPHSLCVDIVDLTLETLRDIAATTEHIVEERFISNGRVLTRDETVFRRSLR